MGCSLFGLFLIVYIGYIVFTNKNYKNMFKQMTILTLVCSLNIRMGYMFKIGDSVIGFSSILVYMTGLIALCIILRLKVVPKKLALSVAAVILVLGIGACRNVLFPYEKSVVAGNWTDYVLGKNVETYISGQSLQAGYYLVLFFTGLILIASHILFDEYDFHDILTCAIRFSKVSIAIGYIEYITKNIFSSRIITDIFIAIFGSQGAQQNLLVDRGGLFAIQGATKEASMFTTVLFYIAIMLIVDYGKNKTTNNKKWLFGCVGLLVLNPALSSIVYLGILSLIWISYKDILRRKKTGKLKIWRIVLVIVAIVIVGGILISNSDAMLNSNNYLLRRVGISLQQLMAIISESGTLIYSSEAIRLSGIVYDLKLLAERPLFGFGLGSVSCNSGIVTMLVNVGIVGFGTWYYMLNVYANLKNSLDERVFLIYVAILPSIFLNDYETIFCIAIPIIARCFSYLSVSKDCYQKEVEKLEGRVNNGKATNKCCYIDI